MAELSAATGVAERLIWNYVFHTHRYYKRFVIAKKSGSSGRKIAAPSRALKGLQRWILYFVLRPRHLHECAHGFRPGGSIVANASRHIASEFVANADIRDFFPSISASRVCGMFKSLGYGKQAAFAMTRICTLDGRLPQGAPTSPDISNLICRRMDARLARLCEARGWSYSRYADDITVSGAGRSQGAIKLIAHVVEQEGFDVNTSKCRVARRGAAQIVTGLVVNERVAVPRAYRRRLRAMIHQLHVQTETAVAQRTAIAGRLAFVRWVNPDDAVVTYAQRLKAIGSESADPETPPLNETPPEQDQ